MTEQEQADIDVMINLLSKSCVNALNLEKWELARRLGRAIEAMRTPMNKGVKHGEV